MFTTIFQVVNTLLLVMIFIGIPYLLFSLIRKINRIEEKLEKIERLVSDKELFIEK